MVQAYICSNCLTKSSKWQGKCHVCQQWNSFAPLDAPVEKTVHNELWRADAEHDDSLARISTNLIAIDKMAAGGMLPGSILMLAGPPGVGKTTMLLELLNGLSQNQSINRVLYISSEESMLQLQQRLRWLKIKSGKIYCSYQTSFSKVLEHVEELQPQVVALDSYHSLIFAERDIWTEKDVTFKEKLLGFISYIKDRNVLCLLTAQINKNERISGPMLLEHSVDIVLQFCFEQEERRTITVSKNRNGQKGEPITFTITTEGLEYLIS